jgi:hypothetical protein
MCIYILIYINICSYMYISMYIALNVSEIRCVLKMRCIFNVIIIFVLGEKYQIIGICHVQWHLIIEHNGN